MNNDLSADWSGVVVLSAANYWHGVRYQDRHIAEGLSESRPVLYVDPPLSPLAALKHPWLREALRGPRLRLVAPSIARLTPLALPGPARPGSTRITSRLVRRQISSALRALAASAAAVVTASPLLDLSRLAPGAPYIYWCQDDLAGGADLLGLDAGRLRESDARQAERADELVVSSPAVANVWTERGYRPHFIPYGCDIPAYAAVDSAPLPTDVGLEPPIVGFVGLLSSRIDLALLEAVAERGRSLLLVGPRHWLFDADSLDRLLALPNVCWVGGKDYSELPSYLRVIDVGVVPYTDSAFNRGSFPLKTLEYLSAGRAVVSSDLPAVRWLSTDLVRIARSPVEFADAVDDELARARTEEIRRRRQDFASHHSWRQRAESFANVIDGGGDEA